MPTAAVTSRRVVRCLALLASLAGAAGAQLTTVGSQFWDQGSSGIQGTSELGDAFGAVLAAGDFNCDGYDDLAIGVPFEDVNGDCDGDGTAHDNECASAGAVQIIYGSAQGLHASAGHADQLFTQNSSGMNATAESGDHFGEALAVLPPPSQSSSTCDDLLIGAPDEDITDGLGTHVEAGAVFHLGGTPSGLVPDGVIVQGRDGVPDRPEDDDHFGAAISYSGYFDTDTCPSGYETQVIAIGAPGEGLGLNANGDGSVILVKAPCGACSGGDLPSPFCCGDGSQPCEQIDAGNTNQRFGESLASSGRFLVAGTPGLSFTGVNDGGGLRVYRRPTSSPFTFSFQNSCWQDDGAAGTREDDDQLGEALVMGDFDGDGGLDAAAGVPHEDVGSVSNAGAVSIFYSNGPNGHPTNTGPPRAGTIFDQNDTHFETAQTSDHFGAALASGDFDGDGRDDLAIGVPEENNIDGDVDAGMIHVLYGGGSGIGTSGDQAFDGDSTGFPGESQPKDHLGQALAAGDFDGDGKDDLAIGAPGLASDFLTPGGVFALYGGLPSGHLDRVDFDVASTSFDEGDGTISIGIARTGNVMLPLRVDYSHQGGTAAPGGVDFDNFNGHLDWAAGERGTKTFTIHLINDTVDEVDETIVLDLDTGSDHFHCLAGPDLTITIVDNDADVPGAFHFSSATKNVAEDAGTVSLTVQRTGGTAQASVLFATAPGTAHAGFDYSSVSSARLFAHNQLSTTISIPILDDALREGTETFTVTLTPGNGTVDSPNPVTVSIIDDGDTGLLADGFESGTIFGWLFKSP